MKQNFVAQKISRALIAILFSLTAICMVTVVSAQMKPKVKNIVIVHGAFADASGWEAVFNILKARGYNVTAVQNPLSSLEDDVAATKRILDKQDGPVVLVGHSWAGTVITQAGEHPKVVSLVYVAAFMPKVGENTLDLVGWAPASPENGILPPDSAGWLYYDKAKFHAGFCADVSAEKAEFMFASQAPIFARSFGEPVTECAWITRPSFGIVPMQDNSINPVIERAMYKRAGAKVTELPGNHVIFMSKPKQVADVIEEAAMAGAGKNTTAMAGVLTSN
ncbi:MAG: alpha/beta hydrolase [Chitinophagaceae bacterium]